eukprot:TRINITY_DN7066_c0_g1_i1.p1 TRINITY_DN7066_c0_g1~~TRINITY_DN7066_c0_g1_i1.p1  ORF type:complete len:130 (-),score=25.62 TRINITY_DN7066_c0_g1_i1:23-412(-)
MMSKDERFLNVMKGPKFGTSLKANMELYKRVGSCSLLLSIVEGKVDAELESRLEKESAQWREKLEKENDPKIKEVKEEEEEGDNKDMVCTNCTKKGDLKMCAKCQNAYYCCRDCQVQDWPQHKRRCVKV